MSARAIPIRSQSRPTKRVPSVDSARSAKPAGTEIAKPSGLQAPKPQPGNGGTVFDPEAFLAKAGLGRTVLRLKKNEAAFAQGGAAEAIFFVDRKSTRLNSS